MTLVTQWWQSHTTTDIVWLAVGLMGQAMFSIRWIAQWLASEKSGASVMPELFWYLSFAGGMMVLAYGLYKLDPVIIVGQFGLLVYARNLYLLWKPKQPAQAAAQ
jgi:lipid-A-disaccharide synthase-like uncharacterized protein